MAKSKSDRFTPQYDTIGSEEPPKWIKTLLEKQTHSLKTIINDALMTKDSTSQPSKCLKSSAPKQKVLNQPNSSHGSDDDFDTRFGHLIGLNVNDVDLKRNPHYEVEKWVSSFF